MTDLERLKAELERQDSELAACFTSMRALDSDLVISVSPEFMQMHEPVATEPESVPAPWAIRA